jgi:hypothetical protein
MGTDALAANDMEAATLESVLLGGDLERLRPGERVNYMLSVCKSLGLNHLTKPFAFLRLNNKLVMYALKDCTEQLRRNHSISIRITARETTNDVYVVTAQATNTAGRCDESIGAVPLKGLQGEALANAYMKAETKAKRRVTLSISGLGMLDETEVDSIPGAQRVDPPTSEPPAPAKLSAVPPPPAQPPAKPAKQAPPPQTANVSERGLRINKLCKMHPPDGLGWTTPGARGWLRKRFGTDSTNKLTDQQQRDAEVLLLARMDSEDAYHEHVALFASQGRCKADPPEAA